MSPPRPPAIVHCPFCDHRVSQATPRSGNSIGATFWTDGKIEGPMVSKWFDLISCPHQDCNAYFLGSEAKLDVLQPGFGDNDFDDVDPFADDDSEELRWKYTQQFPKSRSLSESDWLTALESGVFGASERQIGARITIWHLSNDQVRKDTSLAVEYSAAQEENMLRLLHLLEMAASKEQRRKSAAEENLLMRAEILRELGNFETARTTLNEIKTGFKSEREQIARLIEAKDRRVCAFQTDESRDTQIWI